MASTYLPLELAHTHLPAPPSIPLAIPELRIPTDRTYPESSRAYAEPLHPEHAVSAVRDPSTGILARAIRNGYALELRTLNPLIAKDRRRDAQGSEVIRISFPDRLLPLTDRCITVSTLEKRVFILVITDAAVVYRLSFPLGGFRLGKADRISFSTEDDEWCEEYEVPQEVVAACGSIRAWIVLDDATMVLGGDDGGVVRLSRSGEGGSVYWTAAHYRPSGKFRLPSLFSRSQLDEQVISFARYSSGTTSLLYALSRDRKLRTWHIESGSCLRTIDVRASPSTDLIPYTDSPSRASGSASITQTSTALVKVVRHPSTTSRYSHLVVVYTPAYQATSPGAFVVFRADANNDLIQAGARACSGSSVGGELRGFEVLSPHSSDGVSTGWRLQVVWETRSGIVVKTAVMDDIFQFTTYLEHPSSFLLTAWQPAIQHTDVERYDAAYFDNLLSSEAPDPADPANTSDIITAFIEHLFHPGRFSTVTLATAYDEYIQLLPRHAAQFVAAANGLTTLQRRFAAVVGCHLAIESDPQTGAPIIEIYRKELKLDWLGIWARVRDLDKQARWAAGTAIIDNHLYVLNREGISTPVVQDISGVIDRFVQSPEAAADLRALPESALTHLYPSLAASKARSGAVALAAAGKYISATLSVQTSEEGGSALEEMERGMRMAFAGGTHLPVEDLAGQTWDDSVEPYLADEDRTAVRRLLSECLDTPSAISQALTFLTSPPLAAEKANPESAFSSLGNALIASTYFSTIAQRYIAARSVLLVGLFQLSETPDALAEDDEAEAFLETLNLCFAVYHKYQVLKWVVEQSAEELVERPRPRKSTKRKAAEDDAIAEVLGGLNFGEDEGTNDGFSGSYSLVHTLLDGQRRQAVSANSLDSIFTGAVTFLSATGAMTEASMTSETTGSDGEFASAILASGLPQTAGRFADLFPMSAGTAYIRGRAALDAGLIGEAVRNLEQAAAGWKSNTLITASLRRTPSSIGEYYSHVADLFAGHSQDAPVVHFGQLAILSMPKPAQSPKSLWTTVFLAYIGLGQYEEAYALLTNTPFIDLQRDFLGQLISVMCESNEVGRLNQIGFAGMQEEVEGLLSYKARNSDPLRFPNYYKVLYSWYISRGDYRSAGDIMYQQGARFGTSSTSKVSGFELAAMQARSYLAAIGALNMVEQRNAWISVPGAPERIARSAKRRRTTRHIPDDHFDKDKRPITILTLADIELEYTLVLTRLRLSSQIPDLLESSVSLSPDEIIGLLVQRDMFDLALSSSASMGIDMTSIFAAIATKCVQLSDVGVGSLRADASSAAWLHASPLTSRLHGSPAALGLRYLQTTLSQHDSSKTQFAYRQAVADTLFELNRDKNKGWQMPAWLVDWEMKRDPESWISSAIRWGWVEEAVDWSAEILREAVPPELLGSKPDVTDIPYNLIDRVIAAAAEGDEKDDKRVQDKVKALKEAVNRRVAGLKKLENR